MGIKNHKKKEKKLFNNDKLFSLSKFGLNIKIPTFNFDKNLMNTVPRMGASTPQRARQPICPNPPLVRMRRNRRIGASVPMQRRWQQMTPQQQIRARSQYIDSDQDNVPNRWDCQPYNPLRQDEEKIINDRIKALPEKFMYVSNEKDALRAVRIWGFDSLEDFENNVGYSTSDLLNAFFHLEDEDFEAYAGKKYSAYEVYKTGKPILLLSGKPQRLYRESFHEYMAMYYKDDYTEKGI